MWIEVESQMTSEVGVDSLLDIIFARLVHPQYLQDRPKASWLTGRVFLPRRGEGGVLT